MNWDQVCIEKKQKPKSKNTNPKIKIQHWTISIHWTPSTTEPTPHDPQPVNPKKGSQNPEPPKPETHTATSIEPQQPTSKIQTHTANIIVKTHETHTATEPTKPRIQYNQPTTEPETNNQPNKPETHRSTTRNSKTEITNPHPFNSPHRFNNP